MQLIADWAPTIVVIIFLLFYKGHLFSYFKQKGKNLADKEDIKSITHLVEEVKNEFIKETEFLKANLTILSNTQLNLINEERNAIVNYIESYFEWYNSSTFMPAMSYENSEIDKLQQDIHIKYSQLLRNDATFNLFVVGEDLKKQVAQLKIETINITKLTVSYLKDIKVNNLYIEKVLLEIKNGIAGKNKEHEALLAERLDFSNKFNAEVLNSENIRALHNDFVSRCREYLYKLINSN